ncbi:sec-independent translocase [Nocardioides lianchengensis]|uniref:Sec-independent protein translocase protein TatB n=1 Tax=Nocardioides lianchengensis TaxID=1045774 RepID=A0A1G6WN98_9ACTN|nr:sec-independent translocase [Nocardioides lianchengensis]NYG09251.1 sec-independent protein translocase protein TatB [Nocardioides lianchengensis]SDD67328.1 sec-independent protein translocase protein TatB [Nocardioides lianchengensis]
MFGIGLPELAILALVAVCVFGPDRIPELARQAGSLIRAAKRLAEGARDELREQLGPEYADLELRDLDPREIVRRHVTSALEDEDRPDDRADDQQDEEDPDDFVVSDPDARDDLDDDPDDDVPTRSTRRHDAPSYADAT